MSPFRGFPRLPLLFAVVTLVPALAIVWLGWRLLEQDERLERQQARDLAEATADRASAAIERELTAWESRLTTKEPIALGGGDAEFSTFVRVDREGRATALGGVPLVYDLGRPDFPDDPHLARWAAIERLEFVDRNANAAAAGYRRLAESPSPAIRAGALLRLARVLRAGGRVTEALIVYDELASIEADVSGDPAPLVARSARIELLSALARTEEARAEAVALGRDLRGGRWPLARATALNAAEGLRPWRRATDEQNWSAATALTDAVHAFWQEWRQAPSGSPGAGRQVVNDGGVEHLVLWRDDGGVLTAYAAAVRPLVGGWQRVWATSGVAVLLVDRMHDHVVAGDPEPDSPAASVTRTAAETRLPWHVRALASTDSERATAGQTRRNSILAALALIGFLIPTTGYLVLRAVNQELALARQQAAFVAAVSHEFRSPLTALSHLTALLRSDFKPSDERRLEYYDALARETERLRGFVETVLDVGRIQAGAARYRPTNVDLGTLVAYVVEEFGRRAAGEHAVSCIVSGAAVVSVDDQALQRAMWNLLDNAAKYSAPKRPIAVRLDCEGDRAIIRIADEGPGIPEAEQPFVFDQFFRGAAAIESAVRGTGIGLSLVRHIVEAHGGTVGVESTSRAGSTFRIELPAAASRDDARRAS